MRMHAYTTGNASKFVQRQQMPTTIVNLQTMTPICGELMWPDGAIAQVYAAAQPLHLGEKTPMYFGSFLEVYEHRGYPGRLGG
jgi:hypothetical protein